MKSSSARQRTKKVIRPHCIVCTSSATVDHFVASGVAYYRCTACTHIFTTKVLTAPYEDYQHEAKYRKWEEYLHNVFRRRVQDIQQFISRGKILDVGCSIGYLLDECVRAGFDARGLEPSPDGVRLARKRGHRVSRGYLSSTTAGAGSYDVVILNHTMEHIPDPIQAVRDIHRLLRPGGIVCIESPNIASIEAVVCGSRWRYLYPTEHFSQFSPRSLRTLVSRNGFRIVRCRTYATPYDFASFTDELRRCLRQRDWKRVIVYIVELPLSTIELLLGRGSAVQCIAVKVPNVRGKK